MSRRFWPSSTSILPLVPTQNLPPIHPSRADQPFDPYWSVRDKRASTNKLPFWKDARHILPTKWGVVGYRGLLKRIDDVCRAIIPPGGNDQAARLDALRGRCRVVWRSKRKLTSPEQTRDFLRREEKVRMVLLNPALWADARLTAHRRSRAASLPPESRPGNTIQFRRLDAIGNTSERALTKQPGTSSTSCHSPTCPSRHRWPHSTVTA